MPAIWVKRRVKFIGGKNKKDVLNYKGFIGSVHFPADDTVFYGKVEGITDLVTFEGGTVKELTDSFQYPVDEHIRED